MMTAWRYKPQNAATSDARQSAQGCSQGEMRDSAMGVGRIVMCGVGVVGVQLGFRVVRCEVCSCEEAFTPPLERVGPR